MRARPLLAAGNKMTVFTCLFGAVHRLISAANNVVDSCAWVWKQADADARALHEFIRHTGQRRSDDREQTFGLRDCIF